MELCPFDNEPGHGEEGQGQWLISHVRSLLWVSFNVVGLVTGTGMWMIKNFVYVRKFYCRTLNGELANTELLINQVMFIVNYLTSW